MKVVHFFLFILALCLAFSGCPMDNDDADTGPETALSQVDGVYTLKFSVPVGGTRYFSLLDGTEISNPASAEWDIAFADTRLIYTNSGYTATKLGTGGYGKVWYTSKTDFASVTEDDAVTEETDPSLTILNKYTTDQKCWVWNMEGPHERRINVMTFAGYPNEAEHDASSQEQALAGALVNYDYNKRQFYLNPPLPGGGLRMPPEFEPTLQVYIIQHGDGVGVSKIQISEFVRDFGSATDHYTLIWKTFE